MVQEEAPRPARAPWTLRAGPEGRNGSAGGLFHGLLAHHLEAAAMVCDALPRALAFELQTHRTVVADGAWILPEWSARLEIDGAGVMPIFLHEPGAEHLRAAMTSRRSMPMAAPWHDRSARLAFLFGKTVAGEASRLGLPLVESRPYESLVERVSAHVA